MGKRFILLAVLLVFAVAPLKGADAGEIDVLVNKLVEKGVLTPYEAQILLADAKEEAAKELAAGKAVTAPSWTQKIKMKGDVRFRTQTGWYKGLGPAHERIRNRVRARIGVEGEVNDQVKAGVRLVTGGNDPRSTNQTLEHTFESFDCRLDMYYINWHPELPKNMGSGDLWLGKFKNRLNKSEVLWDGDINPDGILAQYDSSTFELGEVPTELYGNFGFFWLEEITRSQHDPVMYVMQGGLRMDINSDWDAKLDLSAAYYDLAHMKSNPNYRSTGNSPDFSAGTNTTWTIDGVANQWRYDYNLVDVMIRYDAKKFFDFEMGHGIWSDMIWNVASGVSSDDFGFEVGAYLGKKKPKKPGQWKIWGLYRYIERDAVPDTLPDSDFFGFTQRGVPAGGGTNGQGFNGGIQYALFKNTVLALEYYYVTPIDINSSLTNEYDQAAQLLQMDVKVKF
ncbi:MAG: hypothetical protein GF408_06950 [Candidatus Omnitrophica bacterium]|nr:hypothetical protein [Candidatus Omnitrophota bacterium]